LDSEVKLFHLIIIFFEESKREVSRTRMSK
jgi:hypothetical protein